MYIIHCIPFAKGVHESLLWSSNDIVSVSKIKKYNHTRKFRKLRSAVAVYTVSAVSQFP